MRYYAIGSKSRALATACTLALASAAAPSFAQTVVPPRVPLSDVDCGGNPNPTLASCVVDGTRTGSGATTTTAPVTATTTRITHTENVAFDGALRVYGRPVATVAGQPFDFPSFIAFDPGLAQVEASTAYTGTTSFVTSNDFVSAAVDFFNEPQPGFMRYDVTSLDVTSIGVDVVDGSVFDAASGIDFNYDLATLDPTNIVNNSTALAGRFSSDDDSGRIIMGTLTGSVSVIAAPQNGALLTPASIDYDGDGSISGGWVSPFAAEYDVVATVTTQLDETGLMTPVVVVTDGIQMNGSRVSGLGAGVNPDDAVNVAQFNAETAARMQADLQMDQRIAVQEANSAALAAALTTETNARIAADVSMQNQLNSFDDRLDTFESRLQQLDSRVASSTATAVAMSGNAFLPDMKFNLTANVATYDGAHAGSVQLGALVTRNVAVNAGVATGFNKNGKTAARVGMTFGW